MKRVLVVLFLVLASVLPSVAQSQPAHAGAWWREKSSIFKEAFVGGYKTGAHHQAGQDTQLSRFGAKELVDGLNKFYSDFRNRNISINESLFYVADQLSGVPDEKLNAELLKLRAASAGAAQEDQ